MDSDNIRDAIQEAFGRASIPNSLSIITEQNQKNAAGAERFRRAIAGKDWRSLTPGFLEEWWSSFCYLSPSAYCYYLPALLDWALNASDHDAMHTVLFGIAPSYRSLYYLGGDAQFQARQAAFSPHQYRTVTRFLGYAFEFVPHMKHLAAQALFWGWYRIDTPELAAVKRYYEELRTFTYTQPDDPETSSLFREIHHAFAETPYPGDNNLCGSDQGDEPAEYALELRGVKWQAVHPQLLARCYAALSFLSDDGFRYFLPAYLVAELCGFESNASPEFHLTHGLYDARMDCLDLNAIRELVDADGAQLKWVRISLQEALDKLTASKDPTSDSSWHDYIVNRLATFNRKERLAIIHYLEYRARDKYEAIGVNEALSSYWRPSVQ